MWILIARGEYAEGEFGDATEDIYHYWGPQHLA